MEKAKPVRNLHSLDREISRLKNQERLVSAKLDQQFEHLQENYPSLLMGVFFKRKKKAEGNSMFGGMFTHEKLQTTLSNISDMVADKAAVWLEKWIDRLVEKDK